MVVNNCCIFDIVVFIILLRLRDWWILRVIFVRSWLCFNCFCIFVVCVCIFFFNFVFWLCNNFNFFVCSWFILVCNFLINLNIIVGFIICSKFVWFIVFSNFFCWLYINNICICFCNIFFWVFYREFVDFIKFSLVFIIVLIGIFVKFIFRK